MKKRHLRKSIQHFIEVITIIMFVFIASINDFELTAIPLILFILILLVINIEVLIKYGN